jgi:hypothetical protein
MQPTSGFNYVGNPDFRGWLAANPDYNQQHSALLNYVGNDGKVDATKLSPNMAQFYGNMASDLYGQYQSQAAAAGGGTGGSTSKVDPNFVNQAYDTKIAGLQSVFDTLDPQEQSARLQVGNQYQNQANTLQTQQAQGHRNLTMAQNQVDEGKAKSLNDLRSQVQTMGMSYNNQLGAYGAGDSSAAGLIQQALSGMASKNRAGVMDSAAQQGQQIQLQGQDLDTEFQNNIKSLDDWKASSLNDIATKFMQQKQAIQQQMVGANADRYQALAQADASYTNQAIQQLAHLEGVYKQQATDLVGRYQGLTAPNQQINPALQQYAVNPISAGQISSISSVPQVQGNNGAYMVPRKFNEDYGLSLQPGY